MKIFGLYTRENTDAMWKSPILYSTNIQKLRVLMRAISGEGTVHVGSNDITNSPNMNSYTEFYGNCLAKIDEMPTLI